MSDSQTPAGSVKPDYRTPIGRARGLGSAKSGTAHFWWQRVTAVVLALLVPWLVGTLVSFIGADLATAHSVLSTPINAILLAAFVLALFWQAKLHRKRVVWGQRGSIRVEFGGGRLNKK